MLIKQPFYFSSKKLTSYLLRKKIYKIAKVAIALWRYASGDSARAISWMVGIGESTCREICFEVAQSICAELAPEFLATPSHEELRCQAELFERGGIPLCQC